MFGCGVNDGHSSAESVQQADSIDNPSPSSDPNVGLVARSQPPDDALLDAAAANGIDNPSPSSDPNVGLVARSQPPDDALLDAE
jgi:hypothetical protein